MSFENLSIDRIIIHEIFKRTEQSMIEPDFGTQLEILDPEALGTLCDRTIRVMGSGTKNVELDIAQTNTDSAISLAKNIIDADDTLFIELSKDFALKLAHAQTSRQIPGGVLVIFSGKSGFPEKRIIGIIKAETHNGFVRQMGTNGVTSLQYLKDLLLTPQTKLYKMGVFIEEDPLTVDPLPIGWRAFVYDDQISPKDQLDAAKYFYDLFLGCRFPETSARRTREFHDYTKEFIQKLSWSEEQKFDLHNALVTYLKVDKSPTIQTSVFSTTYLPDDETKDAYTQFMTTKKFPNGAIIKDLANVTALLKQRKITFSGNVKITAPIEEFNDLVKMRLIDGEKDEHGQIPKWTEVIIRSPIKTQE
jgi:hypothetical protein